jgi:hypothetical protein
MNKTLVIINGTYPYQRSEDYLANEVNYIQGFNKGYSVNVSKK